MEALARRKLGETLKEIRGCLGQLSERGERIGEQDTKAVLIEPVLAALGWHPHDLDDVRREYRRKPQDNPGDYALLIYRTPRLFVEAKALVIPQIRSVPDKSGLCLGRRCHLVPTTCRRATAADSSRIPRRSSL